MSADPISTSTVVHLPDAALRDAVGAVPGAEFVLDQERCEEVEIFVAPYLLGATAADQVAHFPRTRLVQLQSAGYDGVAERLAPGTVLCNATGVHDDVTAELALGLVLTSQRGIDRAVRAHGVWRSAEVRGPDLALADSRVLVLGYGSIGRSIAERLLPFGVQVAGVAARGREDDLLDRVHGVEDLPRLLPETDIVIAVLPLTESTRGILDAETLALLPDGALVVNVGRGPLLDTDAALAEAQAGRLRFALDVTDPEPLPEGHPLWQAPGVLITPHVAGGTVAMLPRIAGLVRSQVQAYVAGDDLANVVAGREAPGRGTTRTARG